MRSRRLKMMMLETRTLDRKLESKPEEGKEENKRCTKSGKRKACG